MDDPEDIASKLGIEHVIKVHNFHKIEINSKVVAGKEKINKTSSNAITKQSFEFDAIFGPDSTQEDLFKEVYHLVMSALDGYQVSIFAFGQTGSGKTFTMEGNINNHTDRGIIPRAIEALFENITKMELQGWEFNIKASFQEIYCDEIRDLLNSENSMKQLKTVLSGLLRLMRDPQEAIVCSNC
jgi:predicted Ser/Thr protein kinase